MDTPECPNGTTSWIELFTAESDRSADFSRDLFGWDQVSLVHPSRALFRLRQPPV